MKHVVFYSGGIASYHTAKRVIAKYGVADVQLLFTDTKYEHVDLYRFLDETVKFLGVPLVNIAEGRDPWQIFKDVKFLGNSRVDPCSKILKRQMAKKWVKANHPDAAVTTLYLGLNYDEMPRLIRSQRFWMPYAVESPLSEPPLMTKDAMLRGCDEDGIAPPELYSLGFPHNNCGGFCIKAGHAHFLHLLKQLPEKYAECEAKEEEMRQQLGDVSILRSRKGGQTTTLTLKQLRITNREDCDYLDWGGCGCFGDVTDDDEQSVEETQ